MKLKRLSDKTVSNVKVIPPITQEEVNEREIDYATLSKMEFSRKYGYLLYSPVELVVDKKSYNIQTNFCANPFCKWYGKEQFKYKNLKRNPSRYMITGKNFKSIKCNDINDNTIDKPVIISYTAPYSNWAMAEEIKRLIDINTTVPIEPYYIFHKEDCCEKDLNPFDNPNSFYRRGKSSSNSQKYQCKLCKKIANVLPEQKECFTYYQKKNDILPLFMKLILSRTPVTRICEILNIGSSTYYNKLEWLYRRCLEFLERYEDKKLKNTHFDTLWLNTDKFTYHLNNVRKRGHGKNSILEKEKPLFPTSIIATTDSRSRYIFRADVAFDFTTSVNEIKNDYIKYKEDKLNTYLQKTSKYKVSKTTTDSALSELELFLRDLEVRKSYIDGFHVNSTYTTYAHHWLINNLLNVDKLFIVTDEDTALLTSLLRIHKEGISKNDTHIFTCKVDKELDKNEAYKQYLTHKENIKLWQEANNLKEGLGKSAIDLLAHTIFNNDIYTTETINGKDYVVGTNNSIPHPFPYKDEGNRYINCVTDLSNLNCYELAEIMYKIDLRSINTFFNQIRRKVSILERPLSGGRGEGKSYIYANFNPKYAQYMITILRTYLNFCETYKYKGEEITPAMRLGIAKKKYKIEDILYFK